MPTLPNKATQTGQAKPTTRKPLTANNGSIGILLLLGMEPTPALKRGNTAEALISLIRTGISRHSSDNLLAVTGLTPTEFAKVIHISDRTLRRYKPEQSFPPEQTERMVELAGLYSRGEEVFGTMDRFREWMGRPQLIFGGKPPKDYLDTSIGIGMILDELGRIEHGIFA